MNIKEILKCLPHRYPMILVDRILEIEEKRIVGLKNVTINESFFPGHFPREPVMPGVLLLEAMAQVGGILLVKKVPEAKGKSIYLMGMDKIRFRKPVVPGDQLRLELDLIKIRSKMAVMDGKAFVDGEKVCEARIMATAVDETVDSAESASKTTVRIHPTAEVESGAKFADGVVVGPYCTVGKDVVIGPDTLLDHHASVSGDTEMGRGNHVFPYAVLGGPPQDVKYEAGQPSRLVIGDDNIFREFVTVNTSAIPGQATRIGNRTWIMAYAHVAHDCVIEDDVKIANAVNMGGHITVEEGAIVGGLTAIHQFVRIGKMAMVGGASRVSKDVLPFVTAGENPLRVVGINTVGLERKGYDKVIVSELKKAFRLAVTAKLSLRDAIQKIKEFGPESEEAKKFLQFLENSERGIHR